MARVTALPRAATGTPDRSTTQSLADASAMAHFVSLLYAAGATLGLVSMVLRQPPGTDELGIYVVLALSYVSAAVALVGGQRFPRVVLPAALAAGTLLITFGTYFTGQVTSVYALFYIWVALAASYFFDRRGALAQTALMAASYGTLLAVQHAPNGPERWLITIGTVLVAGLLVGLMKGRVERLLGDLRTAVAEMTQVARTDPLTGLLNRRGFSELIERELGRTQRTGQPFSLLVSDLDHFKRINDNFGHAAGDAALAKAAEVFQGAVRGIDAVARIGGEELAAVLPDSDPQSAYLIAERVRTALQDAFASQGLALTISTGIASSPADGQDTDALLRAADDAMYRAKGLGRNRTVVHRGPRGAIREPILTREA